MGRSDQSVHARCWMGALGRHVLWVVLSAVLAACSVFVLEGVAQANAYGVSHCKSAAGDDRPSCVFEHGMNGKGIHVTQEYAEAEGLPATLCNLRIDFQYSDVNGAVYKTDRGSYTRPGCTKIFHRYADPQTLRPGKACAILYSNSNAIATQCHNIFA